jgi:hypothetical protein
MIKLAVKTATKQEIPESVAQVDLVNAIAEGGGAHLPRGGVDDEVEHLSGGYAGIEMAPDRAAVRGREDAQVGADIGPVGVARVDDHALDRDIGQVAAAVGPGETCVGAVEDMAGAKAREAHPDLAAVFATETEVGRVAVG